MCVGGDKVIKSGARGGGGLYWGIDCDCPLIKMWIEVEGRNVKISRLQCQCLWS